MLNLLKRFARWYFSKSAMPYWMVLLFDCFVVVAANLFVYILDMGATHTAHHFWPLIGTLLVYLIPYIVGFRLMRTYSGVLRYSSFADLYRLAVANFIGIASVEFSRLFLHSDHWLEVIKWHTLLFAWLLATVVMFGARIIIKYLFDILNEVRALRRVFIYGTKSGGQALAKSIRIEQPLRFHLRGFISDSQDMPGHTLQGVTVYKNDDRIVEVMKAHGATALLVSPLKSAHLMANGEMSERLIDAGIKIYTVQHEQEWDGKSDISAAQIHEVEIGDLLPREEIDVDLKAVEQLLHKRRIMITGSAGSIGSELVRQIAKWEPAQLVLVDQAETPQHDIRLMMARDYPGIPFEAVVTSITHRQSLERLFAQYKPEYVFHAAAYKHVPMMEDNPTEAVQNN
ncbi:MAG: polysaccharide biosynthesis protein, partial [Bacteroidaceae bacterium]|nr:polysaccharide biosynthesis protein [Bacteroidaceae bacterium]